MVAMPHGPVLSQTLDCVNQASGPELGDWDGWISDREEHEVSLRRDFASDEELDELSEADLDVLSDIWERFGRMNRWALRDYTHTHCAEWRDPQGSALPISYQDVLRAVGLGEEEAREVAEEIEREESVIRALGAH